MQLWADRLILDMRDPASIAAWVRWAPERHWPQLKAMVKLRPEWREAARKAHESLKEARTKPAQTRASG